MKTNKKKWYQLERGLIKKDENRPTITQLIGFWLVAIGVLYIVVFLILYKHLHAEGMAISFFIIMLGVSFAFPELLKNDKNGGLSTMRIVVFMVVNVICLLLLKIGWGDEIKNLGEIGLDGYWMGVIAFVFGAKATQSYFESKMAVLKDDSNKPRMEEGAQDETFDSKKNNTYFDELNSEDQYQIAQDYIDENFEKITKEYPEITGMYVGKKNIAGKALNLVSIGFQVSKKTNSAKPFPTVVKYKSYRIPTDVQEAGISTPHSVSISSGISKSGDLMYGTLGIPILKEGKLHYLSCYHVYCNQELANKQYKVTNKQNSINPTLISPCEVELNGNKRTVVGEVVEGFLTNYLDIAIMVPKIDIEDNYADFEGPIYYRTLARENENNMFLQFKGNGSKRVKRGKLINIYTSKFIDYHGKKKHLLQGLIQIEKCANDGDSGAAVCDLNGYFIGYVVGSDTNFTYLISAYMIMNNTNYEFNTNT